MKVIYKELLKVTDNQVVSLPVASKILTVQVQRGSLCLWYLKDRDESSFVNRHIHIIGTGHLFNDENLQYIGTVLMAEDMLVWHVFEKLL